MNADRMPPGQGLIRDVARWPVVGETAPRASAAPWTVTVCGLVAAPRVWPLEALLGWPQETRTLDIHCVTRWSQLDRRFSGVALAALIHAAAPLPEARFSRLIARSDRDHDTCLPLDLARESLLAFAAEDAPLASEHGGPVRVIAPGRYFYKSLKWLERVELRAEDHLGYWESGPGYHNGADPWAEQRFVTGNIPPDLRARMIARRSLGKRSLLGVDFSGAALDGLDAAGATLRNCAFCGAVLTNADFSAANLSNADFSGADARGARFVGADVEGVAFDGADLRGADFSYASLFGASFTGPGGAARLDAATRISPEQIAALTDAQAAYLRRALA